MSSIPVPPQEAAAALEYQRATEAMRSGHRAEAARHFLDCTVAYRNRDPGDGSALFNTQVCYRNALYAYVMAGQLETEGRGEMTAAAAADPGMEQYVGQLLLNAPNDCR